MKYTYQITGTTNTGKPSVLVMCEHCGLMDFHLQAQVYTAVLKADPRDDMDAACSEFFERLNAGDNTLFPTRKTARKIRRSLCHCDPDVIDIEHHRSVIQAKAILRAGLEQVAPKND